MAAMSPEQYERARGVFHAAIDLRSGDRLAFVERACVGDTAVRAEVESLLKVRGRAASFLEAGIVDCQATSPLIGKAVGGYEVIREIAAGGMGTVYEAQQREPRRRVALKVVRSAALGKSAFARFRHEAQILGRLSHPSIANVFEAGTHDDGSGSIAFFTMELVEGATDICAFSAGKKLSLADRLTLFLKVCDAVSYAHQRGVIHRDLKPSNIVVDAAGTPKVLDFGLAKLTDSEMDVTSMLTETGQLMGTVAYMSPEQVGGDSDVLDTRSDVYALGVILYQLLTGRLPFDTAKSSLPEKLRAIREDDPTRVGSIDRALLGDVETIVAKAMDKDQSRRYQSVTALADDIGRFLRHEPIAARPASTTYQFAKFARRNRALVGGAAAAILLLVAGIIGTSIGLARAVAARELADRSAAHSRVNEYHASIQAAAVALKTDDVTTALSHLESAPEEHRGWEWRYLMAKSDQSVMTFTAPPGEGASIAISPDGERYLVARSGFLSLLEASTGNVLATRADSSRGQLRFNRDGSKVLFCGAYDGGRTGRFVVLDSTTLAEITRVTVRGAEVMSAAWSPDEKSIAVASGAWGTGNPIDQQIQILDAVTLTEKSVLQGSGGRVEAIDFHPDGRRIWAVDSGHVLTIWELSDGSASPWQVAPGQTIRNFCLSRDGGLLATTGSAGVQLWDANSRALLRHLGDAVRALSFSPDGRTLYGGDAALISWDVATGRAQRRRGHTFAIDRIAVSPDSQDGEPVLTATWSGAEVKAWSFAVPGDVLNFDGYSGAIITPDGRSVIHVDPTRPPGSSRAQHENLLVVRDVATRQTWCTLDSDFTADGADCRVSPDGRYLVRAQTGGAGSRGIAIWNLFSGERLARAPLSDVTDGHAYTAFRPNGGAPPVEVLVTQPNGLAVRRVPDLALLHLWPIEGMNNWGATYSPDGATIAITGADSRGGVRLIDAQTGEQVRAFVSDGSSWAPPAFSPDGKYLAANVGSAAASEGFVRIWEAATGTVVAQFPGKSRFVLFDTSQAPSPGATSYRVFTSRYDGTVRVVGLFMLPAATGKPSAVLTELLPLGSRAGNDWADGLTLGAGPTGEAGARLLMHREWPASECSIWDATPAALSTSRAPTP